MVMISSEMIWDNKWQYGNPVLNKVTYKCNGSCEHTLTYEFKEA
jgi:hypothetical protein